MNQATTWNNAARVVMNVLPSQTSIGVPVYPQVVWPHWNMLSSEVQQPQMPAFAEDAEMRHAYMLSCLEQDIAWQVKVNRERRKLSQRDLAKSIGTHQSAIARAEDPAYGRLSIGTLTKIAKAFECALTVRFVGYDRFFSEVADTSEDALAVRSFAEIER